MSAMVRSYLELTRDLENLATPFADKNAPKKYLQGSEKRFFRSTPIFPMKKRRLMLSI